MTRAHFEQIAREIRAIPEKPERVKAARNVSKLRDFKHHFDFQRFVRLCNAQ